MGATEAERKAADMRLRAERRAGDMLAEKKSGERHTGRGAHKAESHRVIPQLKDIGVSPMQSAGSPEK